MIILYSFMYVKSIIVSEARSCPINYYLLKKIEKMVCGSVITMPIVKTTPVSCSVDLKPSIFFPCMGNML